MCILDVSAELGNENLHVVGHNAQTVKTDIETLCVLISDPVLRSAVEAVLTHQQNIVAELFGLYGSAVCPSGIGCEHDHGRSLEGQVGENQRVAEKNLREIIEHNRGRHSHDFDDENEHSHA